MASPRTRSAVDTLDEQLTEREVALTPVKVDVIKESALKLNEAENRRKNLTAYYNKEKKVPMYLSPMYQPYFSKIMQVQINGITIAFPVDGTTHLVPESFADEITARRIRIDNIITKQDALSNVQNNLEVGPGEGLRIF